eukprot:910152_1
MKIAMYEVISVMRADTIATGNVYNMLFSDDIFDFRSSDDDDDDDDLDLETDLESDLKRKQNELNQHRKLLNMYCSPHPPATKAATVDSLSSTSTRSSNEQQRQVQLELGNNGISVQLTPFHTPIVKSKTKSIQPPIQNESFF